jgi:hypothetical protein
LLLNFCLIEVLQIFNIFFSESALIAHLKEISYDLKKKNMFF